MAMNDETRIAMLAARMRELEGIDNDSSTSMEGSACSESESDGEDSDSDGPNTPEQGSDNAEPLTEQQLNEMTPSERASYEGLQRLNRPLHPRVAAVAPQWIRMHEMMDLFVDKDPDETIPYIVAMIGGTYRDINRRSGDGQTKPYRLIPFADGSTPSAHGLPLLMNMHDIDRLSSEQLTAYCIRYDLEPVPRRLAERRTRIKEWIGCDESMRIG